MSEAWESCWRTGHRGEGTRCYEVALSSESETGEKERRSQDEKCCPQLRVSKLPLGVRWEEWESVSWAPCLNWEVGRLCGFVVSMGTPV